MNIQYKNNVFWNLKLLEYYVLKKVYLYVLSLHNINYMIHLHLKTYNTMLFCVII